MYLSFDNDIINEVSQSGIDLKLSHNQMDDVFRADSQKHSKNSINLSKKDSEEIMSLDMEEHSISLFDKYKDEV